MYITYILIIIKHRYLILKLQTRKRRHLLLMSYHMSAVKYNGKIYEYGVRRPLLCHLLSDAGILHSFLYERKVVERWCQHSLRLWFCDALGLLYLGIHLQMSQIVRFFSTELICRPFQEGGSLGEMPSWESKYIIHLVKLL